MNIFAYIDSLRQKPIEVRKRYVIVFSFVVMVTITVVWFFFSVLGTLSSLQKPLPPGSEMATTTSEVATTTKNVQ